MSHMSDCDVFHRSAFYFHYINFICGCQTCHKYTVCKYKYKYLGGMSSTSASTSRPTQKLFEYKYKYKY